MNRTLMVLIGAGLIAGTLAARADEPVPQSNSPGWDGVILWDAKFGELSAAAEAARKRHRESAAEAGEPTMSIEQYAKLIEAFKERMKAGDYSHAAALAEVALQRDLAQWQAEFGGEVGSAPMARLVDEFNAALQKGDYEQAEMISWRAYSLDSVDPHAAMMIRIGTYLTSRKGAEAAARWRAAHPKARHPGTITYDARVSRLLSDQGPLSAELRARMEDVSARFDAAIRAGKFDEADAIARETSTLDGLPQAELWAENGHWYVGFLRSMTGSDAGATDAENTDAAADDAARERPSEPSEPQAAAPMPADDRHAGALRLQPRHGGRGEDIVLSNVVSFDVQVWDEGSGTWSHAGATGAENGDAAADDAASRTGASEPSEPQAAAPMPADDQYAKVVNAFNERMKVGDYEEAEALAKEAQRLRPDDPAPDAMFWKSRFARRVTSNPGVASAGQRIRLLEQQLAEARASRDNTRLSSSFRDLRESLARQAAEAEREHGAKHPQVERLQRQLAAIDETLERVAPPLSQKQLASVEREIQQLEQKLAAEQAGLARLEQPDAAMDTPAAPSNPEPPTQDAPSPPELAIYQRHRAELALKLESAREQYGERHPVVVELTRQLAAAEREIASLEETFEWRSQLQQRAQIVAAKLDELQKQRGELALRLLENQGKLGKEHPSVRNLTRQMEVLQQQIEGGNKIRAEIEQMTRVFERRLSDIRRTQGRATATTQGTTVPELVQQSPQESLAMPGRIRPGTPASPERVAATKARLADVRKTELTLELSRLRQQYGDQHPKVQSVLAQLKELDALIAAANTHPTPQTAPAGRALQERLRTWPDSRIGPAELEIYQTRRAELTLELSRLRGQYGPEHPKVRTVLTELKGVEALIAATTTDPVPAPAAQSRPASPPSLDPLAAQASPEGPAQRLRPEATTPAAPADDLLQAVQELRREVQQLRGDVGAIRALLEGRPAAALPPVPADQRLVRLKVTGPRREGAGAAEETLADVQIMTVLGRKAQLQFPGDDGESSPIVFDILLEEVADGSGTDGGARDRTAGDKGWGTCLVTLTMSDTSESPPDLIFQFTTAVSPGQPARVSAPHFTVELTVEPVGTLAASAPAAGPSEKILPPVPFVPRPTGDGAAELPRLERGVLFFTAAWSGPCQKMQPIVNRLAREGLPINTIDVDTHRLLAGAYNVTSIPAFIAIDGGKERERLVGPVAESELRRLLERSTAPRAESTPSRTESTPSRTETVPNRSTVERLRAQPTIEVDPLREKLRQPVDLKAYDKTVLELLEQLEESHGVTIVVDRALPADVRNALVTKTTSLELSGVSLGSTLYLILSPHGLNITLRDGLLVVRDRALAAEETLARVQRKPAEDERVRQILAQPITFTAEAPLADLLQTLSRARGFNIALDAASLRITGNSLNQPFTLRIKDAPLGEALDEALRPLGLMLQLSGGVAKVVARPWTLDELREQAASEAAAPEQASAPDAPASVSPYFDPLAQRITFAADNEPLLEALLRLERVGQVQFTIDRRGNDEVVEAFGRLAEERVTFHWTDISLRSLLRLMLTPLGMSFDIEGKTVRLTLTSRAGGDLLSERDAELPDADREAFLQQIGKRITMAHEGSLGQLIDRLDAEAGLKVRVDPFVRPMLRSAVVLDVKNQQLRRTLDDLLAPLDLTTEIETRIVDQLPDGTPRELPGLFITRRALPLELLPAERLSVR